MTAKIKEWFFDKIQETAGQYSCYINVISRNNDGMIIADTDGYVTVEVDEIIKESDKAVQMKLATGDIEGSYNEWKTWVPKSVIGGIE